jgi:hypothetical protein
VGYVYVTSPCICCKQIFSYNPMRVPSSRAITGQREPICPGCFDLVNAKRKTHGLEPFELLPGAYDPTDESELH